MADFLEALRHHISLHDNLFALVHKDYYYGSSPEGFTVMVMGLVLYPANSISEILISPVFLGIITKFHCLDLDT